MSRAGVRLAQVTLSLQSDEIAKVVCCILMGESLSSMLPSSPSSSHSSLLSGCATNLTSALSALAVNGYLKINFC